MVTHEPPTRRRASGSGRPAWSRQTPATGGDACPSQPCAGVEHGNNSKRDAGSVLTRLPSPAPVRQALPHAAVPVPGHNHLHPAKTPRGAPPFPCRAYRQRVLGQQVKAVQLPVQRLCHHHSVHADVAVDLRSRHHHHRHQHTAVKCPRGGARAMAPGARRCCLVGGLAPPCDAASRERCRCARCCLPAAVGGACAPCGSVEARCRCTRCCPLLLLLLLAAHQLAVVVEEADRVGHVQDAHGQVLVPAGAQSAARIPTCATRLPPPWRAALLQPQ